MNFLSMKNQSKTYQILRMQQKITTHTNNKNRLNHSIQQTVIQMKGAKEKKGKIKDLEENPNNSANIKILLRIRLINGLNNLNKSRRKIKI